MTEVFDDETVEAAFRAAEEALRAGDPDTLAGRFSPRLGASVRESSTASAPAAPAAGRKRAG